MRDLTVTGVRYENMTDEALVELVQQCGIGDAFEELVRRHTPRVQAVAQGMLRDAVEAQDVVQETFMAAFRRLDGFRGDAAFSSWLYRIATNASLMRLRRRRRRPEVSLAVRTEEEIWERPVSDRAERVDRRYEDKELGQAILAGVERLPDSYREVFELAELHQLTMREIATTLNLTVPNVKTRLHRARRKLRQYLQPYLRAEPLVA